MALERAGVVEHKLTQRIDLILQLRHRVGHIERPDATRSGVRTRAFEWTGGANSSFELELM